MKKNILYLRGLAKTIPWQGLLFALFTSIMFGTQVRSVFAILLHLYFKVSAIWYDETGIESLKKEEVGLNQVNFLCYFNLIVGTMGEEIEVEEHTG